MSSGLDSRCVDEEDFETWDCKACIIDFACGFASAICPLNTPLEPVAASLCGVDDDAFLSSVLGSCSSS